MAHFFFLHPMRFVLIVLLAVAAGTASCARRKLFGSFCAPTSVSYALAFGNEKDSGWGCAQGYTMQSTESGFHIGMDIGSGAPGRLVVYGHGDFRPLPKRGIHLALFQQPGGTGAWYCTSGGTLESEGALRRLKMTQIQRLVFPETGAGRNTLDVKNEKLELMLDGVPDRTNNYLGYGCDAAMTHCSVDIGSELAPYRVYVRTKERADHPVAVSEAFVIREEGRSPGRLSFSYVRPAPASRSVFSGAGKPELHLENLPPFQSCPGSNMDGGELTAEWDEKR